MKRSLGRGRRLKAARIATLALVAVGLVAGPTQLVVADHGRSAMTTRDGTPIASVARPAPIVYRPPGLSSARQVPLLVALHGDGGCPQCMEGLTKFEHVADEHGFVVVYPGSTTNPPWNAPDDLSYVRSLVDQVVASQNIDPLRVYVAGFSAGGRMAYEVGCALNGKLAAIAIVSSVMRDFSCGLSHPLSELTIDGGTEAVAISGSSNGIPPALSTAARWRALDGCPDALQSEVSQVGPVRQETWEPCADRTGVGLYILAGGRHTWPGSYGLSPSDPDSQYLASEQIWAFFAAHPAASLTQPSAKVTRLRSATHRRLVVTYSLDESVTVEESVSGRRGTLASKTAKLPSGPHVTLALALPRKLSRGRYKVTIKVHDTYGRGLLVVRRTQLP